MKGRKSQGALEFLTTYGWAFLVILIMIGALGYFGILNPSRFLPERCTTNIEFDCDEFRIERINSQSVSFEVVLKNSLGKSIDVDHGSLVLSSELLTDDIERDLIPSGYGEGEFGGCDFTNSEGVLADDAFADPLLTVSSDTTFSIKCDPKGGPVISLPSTGNKMKVDFNLKYKVQGETLWRSITGEVYASLQ